MDKLTKQLEAVMKELENSIPLMDVGESEEILKNLYSAKRIFVAGSGRSGLAIRAFANRLMHYRSILHQKLNNFIIHQQMGGIV
ncbi:hypothetical protein [Peribacillus loiseleuriae]|uniref:SIS domain-containing protein n=1 Tax=Peribacillus loiseleuriae TaxID=1679170 RepID=A0A0K9GSZ9_9BACI|nr:hypothetical protein [Peribacillus loiseleuriae]KMY49741.1 hypothetical protein AC625_09485 [Peribacillus loiseleuriae]